MYEYFKGDFFLLNVKIENMIRNYFLNRRC